VLPEGVKRGYDPTEPRAVAKELRAVRREARHDVRSLGAALWMGLVTAFPDGEPGKGYREVASDPSGDEVSGCRV